MDILTQIWPPCWQNVRQTAEWGWTFHSHVSVSSKTWQLMSFSSWMSVYLLPLPLYTDFFCFLFCCTFVQIIWKFSLPIIKFQTNTKSLWNWRMWTRKKTRQTAKLSFCHWLFFFQFETEFAARLQNQYMKGNVSVTHFVLCQKNHIAAYTVQW